MYLYTYSLGVKVNFYIACDGLKTKRLIVYVLDWLLDIQAVYKCTLYTTLISLKGYYSFGGLHRTRRTLKRIIDVSPYSKYIAITNLTTDSECRRQRSACK